jgi:hypothetical protein
MKVKMVKQGVLVKDKRGPVGVERGVFRFQGVKFSSSV